MFKIDKFNITNNDDMLFSVSYSLNINECRYLCEFINYII